MIHFSTDFILLIHIRDNSPRKNAHFWLVRVNNMGRDFMPLLPRISDCPSRAIFWLLSPSCPITTIDTKLVPRMPYARFWRVVFRTPHLCPASIAPKPGYPPQVSWSLHSCGLLWNARHISQQRDGPDVSFFARHLDRPFVAHLASRFRGPVSFSCPTRRVWWRKGSIRKVVWHAHRVRQRSIYRDAGHPH